MVIESEEMERLKRRISVLSNEKAELETLVDRMMEQGTVAGVDPERVKRMSDALTESLALNLVVVSNYPHDGTEDRAKHWDSLFEVVRRVLQVENPDATWEDAVLAIAEQSPGRNS